MLPRRRQCGKWITPNHFSRKFLEYLQALNRITSMVRSTSHGKASPASIRYHNQSRHCSPRVTIACDSVHRRLSCSVLYRAKHRFHPNRSRPLLSTTLQPWRRKSTPRQLLLSMSEQPVERLAPSPLLPRRLVPSVWYVHFCLLHNNGGCRNVTICARTSTNEFRHRR